MPDIPDISYHKARALCGRCFHEGRSGAQADLYEIEWDGQAALLKDFSNRPWWVRRLWGRTVIAREVQALRRLAGVPGVPRLIATAGPNAFIMERLTATRMPHRREGPPPPIFWENARALIDNLHARGVGHGDLRRKNVLMGPGGEAYLIDFATAVFRGGPGLRGLLANSMFRSLERVDRITYAKIKASYRGVALKPDEQHWLADQPLYLKVGRIFKKKVYRLRKPAWWRDRMHKLGRWFRNLGK